MQAARLLALTLAIFLAAQPLAAFAQTPATTLWACDAPPGHTCYFSIQSANGGVRNFSIPAGRKMAMGGAMAGRDFYQISIDAPNLGDINRCKQLVTLGRSCQRKALDSAYND